MKLSECNTKQKKAFVNIKHAANDLLGGFENTLLDYSPEEDEYKRAKAILENHDKLVELLYMNATSAIYDSGYCCFDKETCRKELRDINFCGKQ